MSPGLHFPALLIQRVSKASHSEYRNDGVIIRRWTHPRLMRQKLREQEQKTLARSDYIVHARLAKRGYIEFRSEIGRSSHLHKRHAVGFGNVKQTNEFEYNSHGVAGHQGSPPDVKGLRQSPWPNPLAALRRPRGSTSGVCPFCSSRSRLPAQAPMVTSPLGWGGNRR